MNKTKNLNYWYQRCDSASATMHSDALHLKKINNQPFALLDLVARLKAGWSP